MSHASPRCIAIDRSCFFRHSETRDHDSSSGDAPPEAADVKGVNLSLVKVLPILTPATGRRLPRSLALVAIAASAWSAELPGRYFQLIEAGSKQVEARLTADPNVDLEKLEQTPGWKHFGYSVLGPAVLYANRDPANRHYHDAKMLALAIRIGDLLASENEKGKFTPRLDSDWDTWLEAYRLIEDELRGTGAGGGGKRFWRTRRHLCRMRPSGSDFRGTSLLISGPRRTTTRSGPRCCIWLGESSTTRGG